MRNWKSNVLVKSETESKLLQRAMRALMRRSHSESELHEKLRKYSDHANHIEAVIARLKELNYIDDERYVKRYLEAAMQEKGKSLKWVVSKLKMKGIEPSFVKTIMQESHFSDEDSLILFVEKYKRKYPMWDNIRREKLFRALVGAGFSSSLVFSLAKKIERLYNETE